MMIKEREWRVEVWLKGGGWQRFGFRRLTVRKKST